MAVKRKKATRAAKATKAASGARARKAAPARAQKATTRKAAKPAAKPAAKKTRAKAAAPKTKTTRRGANLSAQAAYPATPIAAKQTKAQIYAEIAELTGIAKAEVKQVFGALKNVLERHIKARGAGEFAIPELGIKVRRVHKKATKARMGRNPFTGEDIKIPAKPSRKSVRATALKALKELAE